MIDTYFKQFFWTFHLIVLFGGAFLVARTVNAFVGSALETPAEKIAAGVEERPSFRPRKKNKDDGVPLTAFLDRNLFKAAREDLEPEPELADATKQEETGEFEPDDCQPSTVNAELVATVVSNSTPEASLALFTDRSKQEAEGYRLGDKLLDEAEIMAIEWRRVLVKHNGRCESFSLEEQKEGSPRVAARPAPRPRSRSDGPEFGKGVKKTGAGEYEIPRAEIDNVLSNLNQIATQARIVPSFHNGKANGFKLFSIRPGSLYSKIGIQNGDIIQKINGFEMNSPDKALEIYSKLKDADNISVDLVRRGKTKSLSYNIR